MSKKKDYLSNITRQNKTTTKNRTKNVLALNGSKHLEAEFELKKCLTPFYSLSFIHFEKENKNVRDLLSRFLFFNSFLLGIAKKIIEMISFFFV